jgi:hypothetical protein
LTAAAEAAGEDDNPPAAGAAAPGDADEPVPVPVSVPVSACGAAAEVLAAPGLSLLCAGAAPVAGPCSTFCGFCAAALFL